ncbi:hypothetical protein [Brevundimonas balnearis]|uniref:Uncharacterized protein n=1 Tax=Brevundimonas balnearis TaxID=1572858 RepID=A0ABV6R115_9CAUL
MAMSPILALALVAAQTLDDGPRFDLSCREFADAGILRDQEDHLFSVDLEAATACRRGNPRCAPVVDHGRWLELSYRFSAGEDEWEMFRLYDRQTGWLDQVIRKVGDHGLDYGDAVCEVRPWTGVGSRR